MPAALRTSAGVVRRLPATCDLVDVEDRRRGPRRRPARPGRARRPRPPRRTRRRRPSSAAHLDAAGPDRDAAGRGRDRTRHGSNPTRQVSGTRSTPVRGPHPGPHLAHQRPHVVGRAALVGLDEVGVLGRHLGGAEPQALAPGRVDQAAGRVAGRVGEHRPGVLAARLVGPPPLHDLGDLGLAGGAVARRERQLGPHDELRRRRSTSRGSGGPGPARAPIPSSSARRSTTRTLARLAAMSEPCPPAFMRTAPPIEPGTPDRPLEPGQPRGHRPPGHHRQRRRAARAARAVPSIGRSSANAVAQGERRRRRSRGRRPAGSSPGRRPGSPRRWPAPPRPARRGRPRPRPDEQGGRAADPVGGERPIGTSARARSPSSSAAARTRLGRGHRPARPSRRASSSSGSEVMSPAPSVRHRSPARSSWTRNGTRSLAPRQPHDPRPRVGVEHGVDEQLAGHARAGAARRRRTRR